MDNDGFHTCGYHIGMMQQNPPYMTEAAARAEVEKGFSNCVPCVTSAGGAAPSATVSCADADKQMTDSTYSCGDQIRMMQQYGGMTEAAARARVQTDFNGICVPCT